MSLIRPNSSPENMMVWLDDEDGKIWMVGGLPAPLSSKVVATSSIAMKIPPRDFYRAVKKWHKGDLDEEVGCKYGDFSVKEVHVMWDTGKKVSSNWDPYRGTGKARSEFLISLTFRKKRIMLWKVTWMYIVHNAIEQQEK